MTIVITITTIIIITIITTIITIIILTIITIIILTIIIIITIITFTFDYFFLFLLSSERLATEAALLGAGHARGRTGGLAGALPMCQGFGVSGLGFGV